MTLDYPFFVVRLVTKLAGTRPYHHDTTGQLTMQNRAECSLTWENDLMADNDGDGSITPIRPQRPVTATELRNARITVLRAQMEAGELLMAALGGHHRHPGISAPEAIACLDEPERAAASELRDVLTKPAMSE